MFSAIPLAWKIAAGALGLLLITVAFGVTYAKGRSDGKALVIAEDQKAIVAAQQKATDLANKLAVAQEQALAANTQTQTIYVDRIHNVTTPDTACASDQRMRIGSAGVRQLVKGSSPQSR